SCRGLDHLAEEFHPLCRWQLSARRNDAARMVRDARFDRGAPRGLVAGDAERLADRGEQGVAGGHGFDSREPVGRAKRLVRRSPPTGEGGSVPAIPWRGGHALRALPALRFGAHVIASAPVFSTAPETSALAAVENRDTSSSRPRAGASGSGRRLCRGG